MESWRNWEIAYRRLEQQWPDMRYVYLKRVFAHSFRRQCPELADNIEVVVLEETGLQTPVR